MHNMCLDSMSLIHHIIISLSEAVETGLSISEYMICTFEDLTIAVFQMNSRYYVYDSHSRGVNGSVSAFGAAVLLEFSNRESLINYLRNMYINANFNFSPVIFSFSNSQTNHGTQISKINESTADLFETLKDRQFVEMSHVIHKNTKRRDCENEDPLCKRKYDELPSIIHDEYTRQAICFSRHLDSIDQAINWNIEKTVETLTNDHTYCLSSKKKKPRISNIKNKNTTNFDLNYFLTNYMTNETVLNSCSENLSGKVARYTTVASYNDSKIKKLNSTALNYKNRQNASAFQNVVYTTPSSYCKSCDKFLYKDQIYIVKGCELFLSNIGMSNGNETCSYCFKKLKKNEIPKFHSKYNLLDPGQIPQCLQELSMMEKRLISKIHIFLTIIMLPGGQFAEKGLAIDFPIEIQENVDMLPNKFENCNIITVSYGENKDIKPSHKVRKDVMSKSLNWLKKNNEIYFNLTIDETYLQTMPNSNYTENKMRNVNVEDFEEFGIVNIDYDIPNLGIENVLKTGEKLLHVNLPKCSSSPINAYDLEKGEEGAFPYLFPLGVNGYNQERPMQMDVSDYFHHRLYFKDGRFRKDIGYLMHAVNFYEFKRLLNSVNIHMRMRKNSNGPLTAKDVKNGSYNADILNNSYMFMKFIRGTAAYWKNNLLNLMAMFKTLGPPSLFVTLSANDMHWPDLIMTLKKCSYADACKVTNAIDLVKKDPLLTAIHFQRRFKALLKHVIYGSSQPLGKIIDYFVRVEFQNRGSPHMHMFFWVENFSEIYKNQTKLISYIDNVISTSGLDREAAKYQTHHHTDYCLRKMGKCRFGFPFKECLKTKLLSNIDVVSDSVKGRFYELRRTFHDTYINAFNPTILKHWQANMDIQIIGNAESAAYYVCAYICKSEPEDLKYALSNLFKDMPENLLQRNRLLKIGCCVLKTRKLSSQEAAYRLSDLKLVFSTRDVISLNIKPPQSRYKVLKPKAEREQLPDNSTDIFYINIIDYYRARPLHLENLCLYEFAQWYVKCEQPKAFKNVRGRKPQCRIQLLSPLETIFMRKRVKCTVIRLPKLPFSCDDYFYTLLMAFLPHRFEEEILKKNNTFYTSAKDSFIAKKDNMKLDFLESFTLLDEIETAVRFIRMSKLELEISMNPATTEVQNEINDEVSDICIPIESMGRTAFNNISNDYSFSRTDTNNETYLHDLEVCTLSYDEMEKEILKLTKCQKRVMQFVIDHFKNNKSSPFTIFLTGGGGVGKSHLTRLLINWLRCCTARQMGANTVQVLAPTGTAAKNINGKTIHSALNLPIQHGKEPSLTQLSAKSLKRLRQEFASVHTIVVDEISMVSANMLEYIHRRLCTIKDNDALYGGLNVIVVGDFFQLRPVMGHYAFEHSILWPVFKPFFLVENVRQSENISYAQLLNRARIGMLSSENITLLNTRVLSVERENLANTIHLFPKIKQVKRHNDNIQRILTKPDCEVHIIEAKHVFSQYDLNPKDLVDDEFIPEDDRDAGGLPQMLKVSIGTRVMLIRNIFTSKGLVNGAFGYVIKLEKCGNDVQQIYVKFDDPNIGKTLKHASYQNSIAIDPISQEFYYKGRIIIRYQFPLIPAWASTIHKVQGASLDRAVISIGNDVFEKGMAYVALSRVKKLDGLYLLSFCPQKIQPATKVLKEYARLRSIGKE